MSGRVGGKVAVVTGGARGIGAAIARRLADEGARVALGDTLEADGQRTAAALGDDSFFQLTDVGHKDSVDALVDATLERFGQLDIMVQNAGIYPYTMLPDISPDEWDAVLGVNLRGCFLAIQAAARAIGERGGRIVLTSSITGPRVTSPGHGHYAASKAGINGLIRSAAIELAPRQITVNGVEPGNILTEGMKAERSPDFIRGMEASIPLGRLGTPDDVAHAVLFLASDEAAYITGTTIIVDGGQILPEGKA
ncbi:MAG: SDR family oxidoreductase [Geminicoccaceae bacterium]|nr:SDR family oxidoreductase [Geminicoccaceae bacterium]